MSRLALQIQRHIYNSKKVPRVRLMARARVMARVSIRVRVIGLGYKQYSTQRCVRVRENE